MINEIGEKGENMNVKNFHSHIGSDFNQNNTTLLNSMSFNTPIASLCHLNESNTKVGDNDKISEAKKNESEFNIANPLSDYLSKQTDSSKQFSMNNLLKSSPHSPSRRCIINSK